MKLKIIHSSEKYEWHNHFLWLPKKVRLSNDKERLHTGMINGKYEYAWLWLETVQRRYDGHISFDTDDGEYVYWKQLGN